MINHRQRVDFTQSRESIRSLTVMIRPPHDSPELGASATRLTNYRHLGAPAAAASSPFNHFSHGNSARRVIVYRRFVAVPQLNARYVELELTVTEKPTSAASHRLMGRVGCKKRSHFINSSVAVRGCTFGHSLLRQLQNNRSTFGHFPIAHSEIFGQTV